MSFEYWTITPKIVKTGVTTKISLRPRYEQRSVSAMLKDGSLSVVGISNGGATSSGRYTNWGEFEAVPTVIDETANEITFEVTPDHEGEYAYRLMQQQPNRAVRLLCFDLYACEADLFELRPFRGDMHVHTSYSECGNRDENPRFVAAWGCYAGLDYIAITDHAQREPSVLAQESNDAFGSDFVVFNGEEVHMLSEKQETLVCRNRFIPINHIVNFGGSEGVVKYMNEHIDEYLAEVNERASKLDPAINDRMRFVMAGADWIMDKIHEFGGLAIFAHPFWRAENRRNLPDCVREYIMKQQKFDCMEVIGLGDSADCVEANMNCVAWWQQENMKRGSMIPIVGNTDSHGTRWALNRRATIVFAKDSSFASISNAIKSGRSVAGVFNGTPAQLFGDVRYVQFANYLMREFYPEHDDNNRTVGKLMLDCLNGLAAVEDVKPIVKGRTQRLFKKYWGA